MRCSDCNKFVSYALSDGEIQSSDVSEGDATFDVSLSLECEECGTELKSATLTMTKEFPFDEEHSGHELELVKEDCSATLTKAEAEVSISATVRCTICAVDLTELSLSDKLATSEFEES